MDERELLERLISEVGARAVAEQQRQDALNAMASASKMLAETTAALEMERQTSTQHMTQVESLRMELVKENNNRSVSMIHLKSLALVCGDFLKMPRKRHVKNHLNEAVRAAENWIASNRNV